MKKPNTVFIECPICDFLSEVDSITIYNEVNAKNTYGGEVVVSTDQVSDLIFCEQCTTVIWPKEYAPKPPNIFEEKPKKKKPKKNTKKRLTKKKKSTIIDASKDKNEDIEKS